MADFSPWATAPSNSPRFHLNGVPRIDRLHGLETEVDRAAAVLRLDRLEQLRNGGHPIETLQNPSREPARHVVQDGDSEGAFAPPAELEFVDLVARLTAEQLGQVALRGAEKVDHDRLRTLDRVEGAVLLGDAGDEARRLHAALRGEADEAAVTLTAVPDHGDDEHRRVEPRDQLFEGLLSQAAKSATTSVTPWSMLEKSLSVIVAISRRAGRFSASNAAVKRLIPRPRASSASSTPSCLPIVLPCMSSATVTATSAASGSSARRT